MIITLANGTELNPISVIGEEKSINGTKRDTLTFVFPQEMGLDEIDAIFTAANCEKIILHETVTGDDGTTAEMEHLHTGYVIRAALLRSPVVVALATDTTAEVVENRVMVSMARRNYTEYSLDALKILLGESEV